MPDPAFLQQMMGGADLDYGEEDEEKSIAELKQMYQNSYDRMVEMGYLEVHSEELILKTLHKNAGDVDSTVNALMEQPSSSWFNNYHL